MPRSSPTRALAASPAPQGLRAERDDILRALGASAAVNGGQFAILLVSADGACETYASDALQPRLGNWFCEPLLHEASQLAVQAFEAQRSAPPKFALGQPSGEVISPTSPRVPSLNLPDTDGDASPVNDAASAGRRAGSIGRRATSPVESEDEAMDTYGGGSDDDGDPEWQPDRDAREDGSPAPAVRRSSAQPTLRSVHDLLSAPSTGMQRVASAPAAPQLQMFAPAPQLQTPMSRSTSVASVGPCVPIRFPSEEAVDAYLTGKFEELQQAGCKRVAKAWIKVLEPKKQTRFPYQLGDKSKPAWWPADIRHREPDHLLKGERLQLLVSILRSELVGLNQLEVASSEASAWLEADKALIIRDVCDVTREADRLLTSNHGVFVPFELTVRAPIPPRGSLGNQSPAYQVLRDGESSYNDSPGGSDDGDEPKRKRKRGQPTPSSSASKRKPPARLELPRTIPMPGPSAFATSSDPHLHGLKAGFHAAPAPPPSHGTPYAVHPGYPSHMAAYQLPPGPSSAPAYYQSSPSSAGGSWPWHDPAYSASHTGAHQVHGAEPSSPAAFFNSRPLHGQIEGQYHSYPQQHGSAPHLPQPNYGGAAQDVFHSRPASAASQTGRSESAPAPEPEAIAA